VNAVSAAADHGHDRPADGDLVPRQRAAELAPMIVPQTKGSKQIMDFYANRRTILKDLR
jgi:hypothetical protein